ncbi:MAG: ectonucleotide pyrophosphatase/phosphodiesterase [Dorea formicigenerans]|nr:ectonucleotide pyrophosphatase/phosphodiesterase [Dorea formicigenerans]
MKKLIVISIDSLTDEDIKRAGDTPNINGLINHGTYIRNINGIYPSLTHPCHATIITGRNPGYHGIISNRDYSIPNHPWFNSLSDIKCQTVLDIFKKNGASIACCRWPVTAGNFEKIDYLIPEITDENELKPDCLEHYLKISSTSLHGIIKRYINTLKLKKQPEEDLFSTSCISDIIRTFKPDVVFTHPASVDSYKHKYGVKDPKTLEMIRLADKMVGDIIKAVEDIGMIEQTTFIVLSDHGHERVEREIALNEVFLRDGLFGKLIAYECGHSAEIYLNGISQEDALSYLKSKVNEGLSGISKVFSKDELVKRYGTFGDFSIMVEGDDGIMFSNEIGTQICKDSKEVSTHGHMPDKYPKPIFIAKGPGIAHKTILEDSMLKEASTFLKAMGIDSNGFEEPLDIFL